MILYYTRRKQTIFFLFATCGLLHIDFLVEGFTPALGSGIPRIRIIQRASEIPTVDTEVVHNNDGDDDDDDDWITDMERSKKRRKSRLKPAAANPIEETHDSSDVNVKDGSPSGAETQPKKRMVYTEEEEDLIETLGGKDPNNPSPKREPGFLGDCTLKEIAFDYQIPICYLADVICGWGVQAPIDPDALLGDMVTGEQAFAILEAIHTLDVGALNDRYADYDLMTLCNEYDVDVIDGFELAVKEGWNLPFGVRTFLRVEQEEDFIRILAKDYW